MPARRPAKRRHQPDRELTLEERLAREICAAGFYSGCACAEGKAPATCHKLVWAAHRAIKFLRAEGKMA